MCTSISPRIRRYLCFGGCKVKLASRYSNRIMLLSLNLEDQIISMNISSFEQKVFIFVIAPRCKIEQNFFTNTYYYSFVFKFTVKLESRTGHLENSYQVLHNRFGTKSLVYIVHTNIAKICLICSKTIWMSSIRNYM